MSMLLPFDNIRPSDLLGQYSEWIYFTLILIFFISIAGLTLRKHFDKPYVKPLIISVGLMMTVGVFMMREKLTMIFQGWGIVGTLILVFIAATIPFGLCRGFGMPANRAFYVVYALFYILSWLKFPDVYYYLGENNMGLVNLGLPIIFIVAIYKIVTIWKSKTDLARGFNIGNPLKKEISQELDVQDMESKAIDREENKVTKFEIKTIKDIEASLVEMIGIIQARNSNLNTRDRVRIADTLKKISSKEDVFLKTIQNLKRILQRLRVLDAKQIQEMKNRLARSNGKEKEALEKEIFMEVEKIKIEQNVMALEQKLEQGLGYFNNLLRQAVQVLNSTAYPADAIQHLSQARIDLKNAVIIIDEMRRFEDKLLQLTKNEKRLLKEEKNNA
ncbi:MAG: hypothetical protein KKD69_06070 [Euryarchaeota archaeon]|nr:hypothetical protein [Euryarchaeota archaeon]